MTLVTDKKSELIAATDVRFYEFTQNISYDVGLSQIYFKDFEDGATGDDPQMIYGRNSVEFVVIYGDDVSRNDAHFKVSHLRKMRKSALLELGYELDLCHLDDDDYTKAEIIDQLMSIDHESYYETYAKNNCWRDRDCDYVVSGYSQGDAVQVVTHGNTYQTEDSLTHLFYDTPISGSIDVYCNQELVGELYIDEFLDDAYGSWDKAKVLEKIKAYVPDDAEYKAMLMQWLEDDLPDTIDYSY